MHMFFVLKQNTDNNLSISPENLSPSHFLDDTRQRHTTGISFTTKGRAVCDIAHRATRCVAPTKNGMKFDHNVHNRHSIRLKGYDYVQAGGYYVTLVTLWRECLFGEVIDGEMRLSPLGQIVDECWQSIPKHFPDVELGACVVMPNHIHGIIIIHENDEVVKTPPVPKRGSLGAILGTTKMAVTRRAKRDLKSGNIWQRNYYEHIIRDQADWEHISAYIADNPLNWVDDQENPANVS